MTPFISPCVTGSLETKVTPSPRFAASAASFSFEKIVAGSSLGLASLLSPPPIIDIIDMVELLISIVCSMVPEPSGLILMTESSEIHPIAHDATKARTAIFTVRIHVLPGPWACLRVSSLR